MENLKAAGITWQPLNPQSSGKFITTELHLQLATLAQKFLVALAATPAGSPFHTNVRFKQDYTHINTRAASPLLCRAVLTVLAAIQALRTQGAVFLVAALWPRAVQLPIGEERSTWGEKHQKGLPVNIRPITSTDLPWSSFYTFHDPGNLILHKNIARVFREKNNVFILTVLIKPSVLDLTQWRGLRAEQIHFFW